MFLSLLLLATAIIVTTETPDIDPELQEIITLFTAPDENNTEAITVTEFAEITDTTCATAQEQSSIAITNAIEPSMLAYKHWTGTYSPDKFTLTINGVEVAQGANCTITTTKEPLEISYSYSFMNGMRTGAKTVSYQLNENIAHARITFSWKDNWKVIVDNGTPISQKEINA